MAEQVFLDLPAKGVTVTNARFMVPGETYAMSGIVSVKTTILEGDPGSPAPSAWEKIKISLYASIFLGGASLVSFWVSSWLNGAWHSIWTVAGWSSVIVLALFLVGTSNQKGVPNGPSTYTITLRTSSGEVKALESQDQLFVSKVTQALNDAIIARG
jgi:Family of unknown function (DUF6232)